MRETQIAGRIALGQTSRQIALELGLSHRTVDAHAEHIRKKLKVQSRVQIAAWAVAHGLLSAMQSDAEA